MKLGALLLAVVMLFTLGACVPGPNQLQGANGPRATVAGFWLGVWQGFIAPFVFVVSLFRHDMNIYEVHNNGAWYNFGYLFGLMCFFGGGGHKSRRARKPASAEDDEKPTETISKV
jgi:hypothetical protein